MLRRVFFLDMEHEGKKMPPAKKASTANKENDGPAASGSKSKAKAAAVDTSSVKLAGQGTDSVPVHGRQEGLQPSKYRRRRTR